MGHAEEVALGMTVGRAEEGPEVGVTVEPTDHLQAGSSLAGLAPDRGFHFEEHQRGRALAPGTTGGAWQ